MAAAPSWRGRPEEIVLVEAKLLNRFEDIAHRSVGEFLFRRFACAMGEPAPAEDLDRTNVDNLIVEMLDQPGRERSASAPAQATQKAKLVGA